MAKLPKKLGDLIDAAYLAREAYEARKKELEQDEELAERKDLLAALEAAIIEGFSNNEIDGAKGGIANASVSLTPIPQIDLEAGGWPALWAWAKKHDALDIYEKRIAKAAMRDYLGLEMVNGVPVIKNKVPAVKVFVDKKLSLTKIGKK